MCVHWSLAPVGTLVVVCLIGCQDFEGVFDSQMASQKPVNEIRRPVESESVTPERPVERPVPEQQEELSLSAVTEPAEEPVKRVRIEEPIVEHPVFGGVTRHSVVPSLNARQPGVRFDLSVTLMGDDEDLQQFDYQVEIKDQRGNSKTFPLQLQGNRLLFDQVVAGARLPERFEFQVRYTLRGSGREMSPLRDNWGEFSIAD